MHGVCAFWRGFEIAYHFCWLVGGVNDLRQSNLKRVGQRAAGEIASKPIGSQRFGQDKTGNFPDAL